MKKSAQFRWAIKQSLKLVLISPCNDEADILVVQCQVNELKIRIINGYGLQEGEQLANRFWNSSEQEIIAAKGENCAILLQLDCIVLYKAHSCYIQMNG